MNLERDEEELWFQEQRAKMGDYDNGESGCIHCGRGRVIVGSDAKRRCEKCAWHQEENKLDDDFLEYLR